MKKPDLCCKLASLPASPRICNVLYGRHGLDLISYKVQSRSKERGLKIHKQYLGYLVGGKNDLTMILNF